MAGAQGLALVYCGDGAGQQTSLPPGFEGRQDDLLAMVDHHDGSAQVRRQGPQDP